MADTFATLNGLRVNTFRIHEPFGGVWFADVDLDSTDELTSAATLRVAGQTYVGTFATSQGGVDAETSKRRVWGGAGGWGKLIASLHYHNDATMKRSTVASAAASLVGESIAFMSGADGELGIDFVRQSMPAARVLDQLGLQWWVARDGVTWAGARPTSEATSDVEVLEYDPAARAAVLAFDSPASVQVGTVLRSKKLATAQTVRELEISAKGGKFRGVASCRPVPGKNRTASAIAAISRGAFPNYSFGLSYRYRVIKHNMIPPGDSLGVPDRVDLQPVRKLAGLPDILPVSIWPGMAGLWARLTESGEVLVQFIEGDPTQPIITHYAPRAGTSAPPGWLPVDVYLDASGEVIVGESSELVRLGSGNETLTALQSVGRVVRYGDLITFGPQGTTAAITFAPTANAPVSKVKA